LVLQSKLTPDELLEISGIGPKTLEKIQEFADALPEMDLEEEEPVSEADTVVEGLAEKGLPPVEEATEAGALPEVDEVGSVDEELDEAAAVVVKVEEPAGAVESGDAQPEEELTFDEMFKLKPDTLEEVAVQEDEDESPESGTTTKKKKKKKGVKSRELEYDPDLDMTIAKKKHKRGEGEWDNW